MGRNTANLNFEMIRTLGGLLYCRSNPTKENPDVPQVVNLPVAEVHIRPHREDPSAMRHTCQALQPRTTRNANPEIDQAMVCEEMKAHI
jgi:hypothetical protein